MTSQPGKQTIAIHVLPNISISKGNQRMKFGQLIECNMRNIILEKSHTKCGEETILRPFSKKKKLDTSLEKEFKSFIQLVFTVCQVEDYRNILKIICRPFTFTSYKAFLKTKRGLE